MRERSRLELLEALFTSRDEAGIIDKLYIPRVLDAKFASAGPIVNIGTNSNDHPCIGWRGHADAGESTSDRRRSWFRAGGSAESINEGEYHVLPDGTIRYAVHVQHSTYGISIRCNAWPQPDIPSAWLWLFRHGVRMADAHDIPATDLGAVTCMITSRTTNLGAVRQGDIIPSTLYFFEYPHVEIGPPHVAWGYWSSDEEGNNTSTVTSCYYDRETGDGARWSLQLKLDGLTFMMSRFTVLDYAALTDDLVTLIRDGHAEDQNDDGSNGGINEENRGSEDGSEDDYVDAQDFFS